MEGKVIYYSRIAKAGRNDWFNSFAAEKLGWSLDKVSKHTFAHLLSELLRRQIIVPDPEVIPEPIEKKREPDGPVKKVRRSKKVAPCKPAAAASSLEPLIQTGVQVVQAVQEMKEHPPAQAPIFLHEAQGSTQNVSFGSILEDWYNKTIVTAQNYYDRTSQAYLKRLQAFLLIQQESPPDEMDEFDLQAITLDFQRQKTEFRLFLNEIEKEIHNREAQVQNPDPKWTQNDVPSSDLLSYYHEKRNRQIHFIEQLKKIRDTIAPLIEKISSSSSK